MSLIGAMYTGVSGMMAQSQSIATISDNIANVNTIGYKSAKTNFSTMVTGSNFSSFYMPGSVASNPSRRIDLAGAIQPSGSNTDISIQGNGFMVVNKAASPSSSDSQFLYTRAGSFVPDADGYLKNVAGYYLQGWPTDVNGTPQVTNTGVLEQLQTINVNPINGIARPTKNVKMSANLPSQIAPTDPNATQTAAIHVYDSLGAGHDLLLRFTKSDNVTWNLTVTATDGTITQDVSGGTLYDTIPIVFDGSGAPVTFNSGATMPQVYCTWTNGALDTPITIDLGAVGALTGLTQQAGPFAVVSRTQDGVGYGTYSGLQIGDDGVISAVYDNGEKLKIYKVPLVNFSNPNALIGVTGNAYLQSNASGQYLLKAAKTAGIGSIVSSSLEGSNVDLAGEFATMIVSQRAFSANTKVITSADNMFDALERIR